MRPAAYKIWAEPQVATSGTGVTATGTRFFFTSSSISSIKAKNGQRATETDNSL